MLGWVDHVVLVCYLASMVLLGIWLTRRNQGEEEYFLAGRNMPWFAVGMSIIASLLSSLTYLSEPGEIWNSGLTNFAGRILAIPLEVFIVWLFCIPFMMRFRFTSAYEYLEHRYGDAARTWGTVMFLVMVILWMGFVVLLSARALAVVSNFPLWVIIFTVGIVATLYTMMGGLRAVIWTDVVQVLLLIGGGLFTVVYVAWTTGTGIPHWYQDTLNLLASQNKTEGMPIFSLSPFVRTTVITVALHMTLWHVCTHTANQMTVQRYFSTLDAKTARRSFITGALFGVGINLLLIAVGLAMVSFYFGQGIPLDANLDVASKQSRDLIFPTFAVSRLPPGLGGGILAALLAAAMSSIDSGVNSIATVISIELRKRSRTIARHSEKQEVRLARIITLASGLFITVAAYKLNDLPEKWGAMDAMPRTFNAITGPLGAFFLVGMFVPRVGQKAAIAGTLLGLATSLAIGYFEQWTGLLFRWGILESQPESLSFTWVIPCSMLVTWLSSLLFSLADGRPKHSLAGLTWKTRNQPSPLIKKDPE